MAESVSTNARGPIPSWAYRSASLVLYFFLTCLLYGWGLFDGSKIIIQPGSDQVQEVWFLGWPAYALAHFTNPLMTDWMNFPYGINMMTNTSMPLLGVLGAPITWIFGPVVTYTLLMRLSFVASAAAAQFVARRVGVSRPASLASGLIYGFSSIQIAQGEGHLFLTFCALPPLIFYGIYCIIIKRWSPRKGGAIVGALFGADFLISAERALMTAITIAVAFVVLGVIWLFTFVRQRAAALAQAIEVIKNLALSLLWSVGVAGLILVWPISQMMGHGHVKGKAHVWIQSYETDLQAIFFPSKNTWLHIFNVQEAHGLAVQFPENGAYIGIPLFCLFLYAVVKGWRSPLMKVGAVTTLIMLGMSMGEVLKVNGSKKIVIFGHPYSFHSPYKILTTIKYVENILPVRFMYFVWFGLAIIAAYGLDQIARGRSGARHQKNARSMRTGVAVGVFGLVVLTLAPAGAYPMVPTGVPPWLTTQDAARTIPTNSVVLYWPYPQFESNHGMLNQAVVGYHYKIIGGEAIVGDESGAAVGIVPIPPLQLPSVFIRAYSCLGVPPQPNAPCFYKGGVPPHAYYLPPMPANNAATAAAFRSFVVVNHVSTVLVEASYSPQGEYVVKYLESAFGAPMVKDGGDLLVWTKSMMLGH